MTEHLLTIGNHPWEDPNEAGALFGNQIPFKVVGRRI